MKVSSQSTDRLVLDHKPWFLGLLMIFMSLVFAAIGLGLVMQGDAQVGVPLFLAALIPVGFMALFVARVQVVFDRPQGQVIHRRRSIHGYTSDVLPLSDVLVAEVEEYDSFDSDDGNQITYRPVLRLRNGELRPLLRVFSNGTSHAHVVSAINSWLAEG